MVPRIGAAQGHKVQHDFSRSAVRNMERAGVPLSVAMKITGHKTESIYLRHAITNEDDIRDGLRKLAAQQDREAEQA